MVLIELLADMLEGNTGKLLCAHSASLTELRLRVNREAKLVLLDGTMLAGEQISADRFSKVLNRLMQNSMYACEHELKQGYFTTYDGCRVGVCGRINAGKHSIDSIAGIGSVCIRIPRQIRGCASILADCFREKAQCSMLILSAPGKGKTTMLRELVRQLSEDGRNVAVADERREIASCMDGIPQLDVGPNTDVLEGLSKTLAIPMLVRACAPHVIAVDELGGLEDAKAVLDAVASGVGVIASAHASSFEDAVRRECTAVLLAQDIFQYVAILGDKPGKIKTLRACANEGFRYAQGSFTGFDPAGLYSCGQVDVEHAQAQMRSAGGIAGGDARAAAAYAQFHGTAGHIAAQIGQHALS